MIGESLLATFIGLISGFILEYVNSKKEINNITNGYVKFFLIILLPPIIFESGYNLNIKLFFKNFGTILTFAVLGTFIAVMTTSFLVFFASSIGLFVDYSFKESMGFGSLISATDAVAIISAFKEINVDPSFFQILFGESCLNDAVSIVLYETTIKFDENLSLMESIFFSFFDFGRILIGSIIVGYFIGFLTAFALKLMAGKSKNIDKIELLVMNIMPYVSYLIAQMIGLSGIVAILFNGIAHSTYTKPYLRKFSKIAVKAIYETIAWLFETLAYIFLGLGFSSFSELFKFLSFSMIIYLSLVVLFARAVNIYVCSYLCNKSRTTNYINKNKQVSK